ncbi:hypothetical protein SteCoe_18845 [Stentor coeruleus]|uniref:Protein kinase domain-containing protein n=1 Tax=Stentor coeruleus TaxID=5963 RepID=A0A1R2BVI8_9CILI|nr:hypothetical protein SteCoe_18845 [Stentor coeruleus]
MSTSILTLTVESSLINKRNILGLKTFVALNLGGNSQTTIIQKGATPEWNNAFQFQRSNENFILVTLIEKGVFGEHALGEGILLLSPKKSTKERHATIPVYKYSIKIADIYMKLVENYTDRQQSRIVKEKTPEKFSRLIETPKIQEKHSEPISQPVAKKQDIDLATYGIQLLDLAYGQMIYKSQSGKQEVYIGSIITTGASVAIKISLCDTNDEFNYVQREALAISSLSHPNICKVYGTLLDFNGDKLKNIIVLENCEGISLRHEIEKRKTENKPFTQPLFCKYITDLLSAFAHIQSKHIVHSDVKPDNVIVSANGSLKVIDFGISLHGYSELFDTAKTLKVGETIPHFSPLQLQGYSQFIQGINRECTVKHNPMKSDVYALGLTFMHMASLEPPNELNNLDEGLQRRIDAAIASINYSNSVKSLISQMLTIDEQERPDFICLFNILNLD